MQKYSCISDDFQLFAGMEPMKICNIWVLFGNESKLKLGFGWFWVRIPAYKFVVVKFLSKSLHQSEEIFTAMKIP